MIILEKISNLDDKLFFEFCLDFCHLPLPRLSVIPQSGPGTVNDCATPAPGQCDQIGRISAFLGRAKFRCGGEKMKQFFHKNSPNFRQGGQFGWNSDRIGRVG